MMVLESENCVNPVITGIALNDRLVQIVKKQKKIQDIFRFFRKISAPYIL